MTKSASEGAGRNDSPAGPDVGQLRSESLPAGDFPIPRGADFRLFFSPAVHELIWRHAQESLELEICGVLVGDWLQDSDGPFLSISAAIRCDSAKSKFAEVTFTHEAWSKVNAEMDAKYVGRRIVGWYHSHPDFGIFLSDRDVFIHQNFFSAPGQVAFVVDPVKKTEGVFAWRSGKPTLCPHYWIGDRICTQQSAVSPPRLAGASSESRPEAAGGAAPSASVAPSGGGWLSIAALVAVFLAGYLLASQRSAWERRMLAEGAAAHFGLWKGLRPELDQSLAATRTELAAIEGDLGRMARTSAGAEKTADDEAWRKLRVRLHDLRRLVERTEQVYALSPDELTTLRELYERKMAEIAGEREEPAGKAPSESGSAGDEGAKDRGRKPAADGPPPTRAKPSDERPSGRPSSRPVSPAGDEPPSNK